jgi:hypothetical protein
MNRYVDGVLVNNPPSGAAGGDLSGTYPDPTVARIQGRTVANVAPANTEVMTWNQALARWQPGPGGGAPALFPTQDANDLIVLTLSETVGDYVNTGSAGGNFTVGGGVVRPGATRFSGGALFPDAATARVYGGETIEPAVGESIALWAWVRWFGANTSGSVQMVIGKPASADPVWADPYWCAGLGISDTGGVVAFASHGPSGSHAPPADNPQTVTDSRYRMSAGDPHLIGLRQNGATLDALLDGQVVASAASPYDIIWTGGLIPWILGSVWSPSGDRLNAAIDRVGFCNVDRPDAWWVESYQRGISTYR